MNIYKNRYIETLTEHGGDTTFRLHCCVSKISPLRQGILETQHATVVYVARPNPVICLMVLDPKLVRLKVLRLTVGLF